MSRMLFGMATIVLLALLACRDGTSGPSSIAPIAATPPRSTSASIQGSPVQEQALVERLLAHMPDEVTRLKVRQALYGRWPNEIHDLRIEGNPIGAALLDSIYAIRRGRMLSASHSR